ncbi:serine/arginine repetitive matrix protein 2-like [Capricornis sumatraensis]|uniref:serine/arginine repetitive matrix protein 2-like n=1 Tax=Capricornis sumatraensis TaxID=34865 RepID=UPI0036044270
MGSTQRGTTYHVVKTNKTGSRVAVSTQKGAEVASMTPQRGQGYLVSSNQRSGPGSTIPIGHRRSEAGHTTAVHLSSDYFRSSSPQSGPGHSGAPNPRTETQPRTDASRRASPPRKLTQGESTLCTGQMQRNVSPSREEATRRGVEIRPGRDISNRFSLIPETKSSRRLSFVDQKDDFLLIEDEPPSKVQYPQGVRVPRRPLICPKDEAVQTEPILKSVTAGDIRSPRRPPSPERGGNRIYPDSRSTQRRIPGPESEMGRQNSIYAEPKALRRSVNLESSLTLSGLKDLNSGHKASMRPEPEPGHRPSVYNEIKISPKVLIPSEVEPSMKPSTRGESEGGRRVTISRGAQSASRRTSESPCKSSVFVTPESEYKQYTAKPSDSIYEFPRPTLRPPEPSSRKHSDHVELELTPRPLPPRCLPRYGPDSTWWALLSPEGEMPNRQLTTPDFEPKSPPPPDPSLPFFEMETSPFCEDLMFQREKASPSPLSSPKESPSRLPLREVPQAPKHTSRHPTQRFSVFFMDVSEEMYNRVFWWLKGLCFSLPWVRSGGLGGRRTDEEIFNGSPMFSESDLTRGTQLSLTDPNQDHQAVDQIQSHLTCLPSLASPEAPCTFHSPRQGFTAQKGHSASPFHSSSR